MGEYIKLFDTTAEYNTYIGGSSKVLPNVSLCEDAPTVVHYNPYVDPYNGHEYVDLGLPSGLKWATMNVGANSITDKGLYFQWGDTQGYTREQVGTGEGQKRFYWTDYKYWDGTDSSDPSHATKYNSTDGLTTLVPEDDAAHVNMGGNWMMPTKAQLAELWGNTNNSWVTNYSGSGVNGWLFTSMSDSSKTLFLPASGGCWNGNASSVGSEGNYWSSDVNSSSLSNAWYRNFFSAGAWPSNIGRPSGYMVRGVAL